MTMMNSAKAAERNGISDDDVAVPDGVNVQQPSSGNRNRNVWRTKLNLFSTGLCVVALVYSCCYHHGSGGGGVGDNHQHHHHGAMTSMTATMTNNQTETVPSTVTESASIRQEEERRRDNERGLSRHSSRRSLILADNETEQDLIDQIAMKLRPATLQFEDEKVPKAIKNAFGITMGYSDTELQLKLKPHQFLHLHHMKVRKGREKKKERQFFLLR